MCLEKPGTPQAWSHERVQGWHALELADGTTLSRR